MIKDFWELLIVLLLSLVKELVVIRGVSPSSDESLSCKVVVAVEENEVQGCLDLVNREKMLAVRF